MNHNINWIAGIICSILIVAATGCSRDFLDREPYIGSSAGNFYQTPEDAEAATIACYAPLQMEISAPGSHFRWFFGDVVSDDSNKGGSGPTDAPDLLQFENFVGDPASGIVRGEWQAAYTGIAYCNIALENIPGIEMDELRKAAYLGEAKFLRAFWYFNLVTTFGDVPLVTKPLAPSEYAQPRVPAAQIWAQIESDLGEASFDLPYKGDYNPDSEVGRATKGAANALLAKAFLYQKKWDQCRDACREVFESDEYVLAQDYGSIFTLAGENGSGSIWEIQYANDSGGNWGAQFWSEGTYTNVFTRAREVSDGFGFNLPTQDFVDEFETWQEVQGPIEVTKVDPRLGYTVYQLGQVASDWGELTETSTGFPHPYYARKYFNPRSERAPFGAPEPNGPSNDRVIRLADVYLMYAEACNELGDAAEALTYLGLVRTRAGVPDLGANLSGAILRDLIWHERRVELGLEGHRFFDVVRQGRGPELFGDRGFVEGVHEIFPIPTAEITLSNGEMTQNPGY